MSDKEFLMRMELIVQAAASLTKQCKHRGFVKLGECASCDLDAMTEEIDMRQAKIASGEREAAKAQGGHKSLLEDLP